jgi:hypothetical protein
MRRANDAYALILREFLQIHLRQRLVPLLAVAEFADTARRIKLCESIRHVMPGEGGHRRFQLVVFLALDGADLGGLEPGIGFEKPKAVAPAADRAVLK